jgi:hypothetical protein
VETAATKLSVERPVGALRTPRKSDEPRRHPSEACEEEVAREVSVAVGRHTRGRFIARAQTGAQPLALHIAQKRARQSFSRVQFWRVR